MGILEELQRLKDAEDFFEYFGIEYDEGIVKPYRLHILKKFNLYLKEVLENQVELDDENLYVILKEGFMMAYEIFLNSSPIKERLFKVHRDVIPFITLESKRDGKKV
ncbi:Nitrogenase-stabilizing/protective protein NifW 2 [bacterium HR13]|nr:Nitrogenase-stabilizing/protective protein NifW 2 [bacterium HR13]